MVMSSKRFPFPIPYGWFHICFTGQLLSGDIHTFKRFSKELIFWKTHCGIISLQDAHCPKCGANLGYGGRVIGKELKCPTKTCSFQAKSGGYNEINTYPIAQRHGIVMAWYHPKNEAPLYELPTVGEFEDPDFVTPISTEHNVKTCLQEMGENAADSAHFSTVHGHLAAAEYKKFELKNHIMNMESTQTFPSSEGPVRGTLKSRSVGFGWAEVRYKTLIDVCMLTTNAPIDDENVIQYFHVSYRNRNNDPKIDRIACVFNKEVNRQLRDDITIWEHKRYEPNPVLCDGDGPIARYRKWAKQFYLINGKN